SGASGGRRPTVRHGCGLERSRETSATSSATELTVCQELDEVGPGAFAPGPVSLVGHVPGRAATVPTNTVRSSRWAVCREVSAGWATRWKCQPGGYPDDQATRIAVTTPGDGRVTSARPSRGAGQLPGWDGNDRSGSD